MVRSVIAAILTLVLALGIVADARADIMTPPGLQPGQQFRIVFVTAATTSATSRSLSTYDAVVSGDAAAGGLATYNGSPVIWEAIGSTPTVNAITRLPADGVPLFLPDGSLVAPTGAALWNTLSTPLIHPIIEHANGVMDSGHFAWTGTDPTGVGQFLNELGRGRVGTGGDTFADSSWVDTGFSSSGGVARPLYGFSSVLTVPVPEPGTLALALVGIGGLVGTHLDRRRRKAASRPTE